MGSAIRFIRDRESVGIVGRGMHGIDNYAFGTFVTSAKICSPVIYGSGKLLELHRSGKETILRFFELFIVSQWECACSTDLDGAKTEAFMRLWDSMLCRLIGSHEVSLLDLQTENLPAFI
ncbi:hypothetical protein ACEPAH_7090 [Sanghuangporus vaninii]